MNYALIGYGRMGRAIDGQAAARGHRRVAIVDPCAGGESVAGLGSEDLETVDMAFEFTVGEAAEINVLALLAAGIPVVCGTTGWQPSSGFHGRVEQAAAGLVLAPNFSVGMNLFFRLTDYCGRMIGRLGLHEPYVSEAHHRGKRDAPSGTARRLAAILLAADGRLESVHEGNPVGVLPGGTLQVLSTRVGNEAGTHIVGFDGRDDVITLKHSARSPDAFALGAVLAAEWLGGRKGLYAFEDVLDEILDGSVGDSSAGGGEG